MSKRTIFILILTVLSIAAMAALARRNSQARASLSAPLTVVSNPSSNRPRAVSEQQPLTPAVESTDSQPPVVPSAIQSSDPPMISVGISVEQAYAAIPHRRTVWNDSESTVPEEEKAYLKTIFQVIDQAIAVRIAGLQNFSNTQFDSVDVDGAWDQLITFTQAMTVPKSLAGYHRDVLDSFSNERQFFSAWKSKRDQFEYARQIGGYPGVRAASTASRAGYNELMARYPNENQNNKDAFYDYHCALDFL